MKANRKSIKTVEFWKMNGCGNDFVLIDNRDGGIGEQEMVPLTKGICRRRESVGADGVIFVIGSGQYDFAWRFFNADGSEGEMCGNGSRCVARFAFLKGIAGPNMTFGTLAGPITAEVRDRIVKVLMPRPTELRLNLTLPMRPGWKSVDFVNTGVPHTVILVEEPSSHPVASEGREVRFDPFFSPAGTNVDYIKILDPHAIEVRTYERGVEDETLACGTGSMASALISSIRGLTSSPVKVRTRSGEELQIYFEMEGEKIDSVWIEGGTSIVCTQARLNEEGL